MDDSGFVKASDREAGSGLLNAARLNKRDSLKYLIETGVFLNCTDLRNGYTPLMWSAGEVYEGATEILIKDGAELNLQYTNGETALLLAAANSKTNTLKELIKAGANVSIRDIEGLTALDRAVRNKHDDTRNELEKVRVIQ